MTSNFDRIAIFMSVHAHAVHDSLLVTIVCPNFNTSNIQPVLIGSFITYNDGKNKFIY